MRCIHPTHPSKMIEQSNSTEMARSLSPPSFITQRQYIDNAAVMGPIVSPANPKIRRSMKMDDADRPWFFKHSDNSKDVLIMKNRPRGSFFVRPSSHEHCYCLVWVDEEITDVQPGALKKKLIYRTYPGYSLDNECQIYEDGWFPDLSSVISRLKKELNLSHGVNRREACRHGYMEEDRTATATMVVNDIVRHMESGRGPSHVSWALHITEIEGEVRARPRHDLETRTTATYGKYEYGVPNLLPLNSQHINLLARGLSCDCIQTTTLILSGVYGNGLYFTSVIEDEQAILLADGIAGNRSLRAIDLSCNRITDKGACALASAFQQAHTLENVRLDRNFIWNQGLLRLTEVFAQSSQFKSFSFQFQLQSAVGGGPKYTSGSNFFSRMYSVVSSGLTRQKELQTKCNTGLVVGFYSPEYIDQKLQSELRFCATEGVYTLYLRPDRCCAVYLAIALRSGQKKHFMIRRVLGGYALGTVKGNAGNFENEHGSDIAYVPTLFEMAAWSVWGTKRANELSEWDQHKVNQQHLMWLLWRPLVEPSRLQCDKHAGYTETCRCTCCVDTSTGGSEVVEVTCRCNCGPHRLPFGSGGLSRRRRTENSIAGRVYPKLADLVSDFVLLSNHSMKKIGAERF